MDVNYIIYDLDYALEKQCINLINELKSVHFNYLQSIEKESNVIESTNNTNNKNTMFDFGDKDNGTDFERLDLAKEIERELGLKQSETTLDSNIYEQIFKTKREGSYAVKKCKEFGRNFNTENHEEKLLNYKLIKALFINNYKQNEDLEKIPNFNYGKEKEKQHLKELLLIYIKVRNVLSPEFIKYEDVMLKLFFDYDNIVDALFESTQFYLKIENRGSIDKNIAVSIQKLAYDIVPSLENIFDISLLSKDNKNYIKYSALEAFYIDISRQIQIEILKTVKEAHSIFKDYVDEIKKSNEQILSEENPKEISENFRLYDYAIKTYQSENQDFSDESIRQIAKNVNTRSLKRIKDKIDSNKSYFNHLLGDISEMDIAYYEKLTKIKSERMNLNKLKNHFENFSANINEEDDDKRRLLTLVEYQFLKVLRLLIRESMNLGYVYITDERVKAFDIILKYQYWMLQKENYMNYCLYSYIRPLELLKELAQRIEHKIKTYVSVTEALAKEHMVE